MTADPISVFFRPAEEEPPPQKAVTIRLPFRVFRYLEEMTERADMSRNSMAVQLMEWGVAHAFSQLPDDLRDEIAEAVDGPDHIHSKEA